MKTRELAINGFWAMDKNALAKPNALRAGIFDDDDDIVPSLDATVMNGVAIIAVTGILTKYESWWSGTSTLQLKNLVNRLIVDSSVTGILLWIDSPGGMVDGVADAAEAIAECPKPTAAVISDTCCSGAYWLASQCDTIYANQTAVVGGIGVYEVWADTSKMYEKEGITCHIVKAGARKGVGAPGVPIAEDDLQGEQQLVDDLYGLFVAAVTSTRTLTAKVDEVANGDAFIADRAMALGLVDEIGDLNDAFEDLQMSKNDIASQITTAAAATKPETQASSPAPAVDVEAIKTAAVNAERARFGEILKACGGRHELACTEYAAGHDVNAAREAYVAALESEAKAAKAEAAAGISPGTTPVAVAGAVAVGGDPAANDEAEWAKNENNLQAKFAGIKANFLATRKMEREKNVRIVK